MVEVDGETGGDDGCYFGLRLDDEGFKFYCDLADVMVFIALGYPDVDLEVSLVEVFEEEVILGYLEAELGLEVAVAALGEFGVHGIVVVEVDGCQD